MHPKIKLSQDWLKIIACLTMLIDHIGAVFFPGVSWFRIIGRISFPIYTFLLAEGIHHSRNMRKYGLRLLLIAILVELPHDLLFYGLFTWAKNSVMITLLLGFGAGVCGKNKPLWQQFLVAIPFILMGHYCKGAYGMYGVAMIAMFQLPRDLSGKLPIQWLLMLVLSLCMAGFPGNLSVQIWALAAMVPITLYSGEKRSRSKAVQWGFSLFYPSHILLLLLIRAF